MVAEPAKEFWIPSWDGAASSLERYEEDVLIFLHSTPEDKRTTVGPRLLSQFPAGSPQRTYGLELLKSGVLVKKDGAEKLLEALKLHLGKDTQQDVSEHYKRFLHRSSRLYQQSMQHYIAEESALHEKALLAVRSVAKESGEVKEIISTVLRG